MRKFQETKELKEKASSIIVSHVDYGPIVAAYCPAVTARPCLSLKNADTDNSRRLYLPATDIFGVVLTSLVK
jgi:hypothetical protein